MFLLEQFRTTQAGSLHEQWLALVQDDSEQEYCRKFIELSTPLENVFDEVALGNFLNGLKPEIRIEVRILEPNNLGQAMELAQNIEEKLWVTITLKQLGGFPRASGTTQGTNMPSKASQSTFGANPSTANLTKDVRKLSDSKLQRKLEKGLCYRCDEK